MKKLSLAVALLLIGSTNQIRINTRYNEEAAASEPY